MKFVVSILFGINGVRDRMAAREREKRREKNDIRRRRRADGGGLMFICGENV